MGYVAVHVVSLLNIMKKCFLYLYFLHHQIDLLIHGIEKYEITQFLEVEKIVEKISNISNIEDITKSFETSKLESYQMMCIETNSSSKLCSSMNVKVKSCYSVQKV